MITSNITARLERLPITWVHYRLLLVHGFGWLFDAMDVGIVTFVLAPLAKQWSLSPSQVGLIGSAGLAGMFIGALLSGILADRWGRRAVFQVTLLTFAVGTAMCALASSVSWMLAARLLTGLGLGGELPVVSALMSEFIPSRYRGRFIVWLESFWALGWLLAAVVAFEIIPRYGWRLAFSVGAIPAAYIWIIRRKLPESPRWLESKGRLSEAESIVAAMELETERRCSTPLSPLIRIATEPVGPMPAGGASALWSQTYRRRTLMLWILWFGLGFGYYGIFVWLPSLLMKSGYSMVNSFRYVILITLAQIPGYFSAAYLVDRLGRRPVIATYLLLSAACAFLFGQASSTVPILLWASLMSFFNLGAWGGVYTYTSELYPTRARATGAGSAAAVGRVGGMLAPFTVGWLLPVVGTGGILTLNATALLIAAGSVALLGVETKLKALEEIAA